MVVPRYVWFSCVCFVLRDPRLGFWSYWCAVTRLKPRLCGLASRSGGYGPVGQTTETILGGEKKLVVCAA